MAGSWASGKRFTLKEIFLNKLATYLSNASAKRGEEWILYILRSQGKIKPLRKCF